MFSCASLIDTDLRQSLGIDKLEMLCVLKRSGHGTLVINLEGKQPGLKMEDNEFCLGQLIALMLNKSKGHGLQIQMLEGPDSLEVSIVFVLGIQ